MRTLIRRGGWLALAAAAAIAFAGCDDDAPAPPVAPLDADPSAIVSIQDDTVAAQGVDPTGRIRQMADLGAAVVRVDLRWDQVAPTRPARPADPGDPAYRWDHYDTVVAAAEGAGVEVLFTVYGTPAWAVDPSVTPPGDGSTQPWSIAPADPADFGAFATAAAARYTPRGVRRWEGWNEPNIPLFLYPQYERQEGRWVATSPAVYTGLQRAFHAGIRSVAPDAVIAGGVTAPAGDPCGEECPVGSVPAPPVRVRPDVFLRALDRPGRRPPMDVVSHHPYPITAPRERTPPNRNYIDLYNVDVLFDVIDGGYLRGRPVWFTEYGFSTGSIPIYPLAFSEDEQAAYIVDAFRRLRDLPRVELATYYLLRDHAGWRSGLLDLEGARKPGADAFALPLATASDEVAAGERVRVDGQVRPAAGATTVMLQSRAAGGDWGELAAVATGEDGTFAVELRPERTTELRAVWSGTSRAGTAVSVTGRPVTIGVRAAP